MMESSKSHQWLERGILAGILLVAVLLRFWGITESGIFSVDEGRYLLDAQSKLAEMQGWAGIAQGKFAEMRGGPEFQLEPYVQTLQSQLAAHAPFLPKVLFSYLVALVMSVTGFTVWAGNAVEAGFGALTVAATYVFAARLLGKRTGILAAGLLAILCYHVYYSRNTYPQCTSGFFFLAAMMAHHAWNEAAREGRPARRWLAASGVCAGLSFLANFQAAGALSALAFAHIATSAARPGWRARAQACCIEGAWLAMSFCAVLLLAEASTYPMVLMFHSFGMEFPHQTFFELLAPRMGMHTGVGVNTAGVLLFPYFLSMFEKGHVLLGLLLLLGAAAQLRKREWTPRARVALMYLAAACLPWAIYSFKSLQGARTFVYILPLFAICLAQCVLALWRHPFPAAPRLKQGLIGVACALVAISSLYGDVQTLRLRSAYPEAMAFIAQTPERAACASWSAVLDCYLQVNGLDGGSYYDYAASGEAPPPYFMSDFQELYYQHYPDEPLVAPTGAIPAHVFRHRLSPAFLAAEVLPPYGRTMESIRYVNTLDANRAEALCVFDLRQTGVRQADAPSGTAHKGLWDLYPSKKSP